MEVLLVSDFTISLFLNIKVSTQCDVLALVLVLDEEMCLLLFIVVQAEYDSWSVL